MIRSLRESKAKLSELVERASQGEEVLITVRGKVKARVTGATRRGVAEDRRAWVKQLRTLQKACTSGKPTTSIEKILVETREDRV